MSGAWSALREAVPIGYESGTRRTVGPAQTIDRVMRLAPAIGLTRLADVTGLDCIGIPVVMAYRPNSRSLAVSQGKGPSLDDARASAAMESTELFHAESIDHALRLASIDEMADQAPIVDVSRLPRLTAASIDTGRQILWIAGVDILASEPALVWIPYEMVQMSTVDMRSRPTLGCLSISSNGLASGNHIVEAVAHGIYEVIERDASALFTTATDEERAHRLVDLDSVDDALCRDLLARFDRAGVDVLVWDQSHDLDVPVYEALIMERDPNSRRAVDNAAGIGAHPSRSVALCRALTEAAQSRLTQISGARDDMSRRVFARARGARASEVLRQMVAGAHPRRFDDAPSFEADTVNAELDYALSNLVAHGFVEVAVVDLTRPDLGIPVARVVIPGLEGLVHEGHARLSPRAYRRRAAIDYLRAPNAS